MKSFFTALVHLGEIFLAVYWTGTAALSVYRMFHGEHPSPEIMLFLVVATPFLSFPFDPTRD